jgi:hypothetical protein
MNNRNNSKRYLIYKGTGGLIHMLCGLVHCISWAKKNNHILIIDVKSHHCYKHYLSDFFIINCPELIYSEDYNIIEPNVKFNNKSMDYIKNYPDVEYNIEPNTVYKYQIDNINIRRKLTIDDSQRKIKIFAGPGSYGGPKFNLLIKYIKVKPEILNIIKEKPFIDNYIGVHYRNTDIRTNFNTIVNNIRQYSKYNNIYLATDDYTAYDKLKKIFPNHTIYQYTKPIDSNGLPIHYTFDDKYNLVLNLLIDLYFLYNSNEFINSESSLVSNLVLNMRNNKTSIF